MIARLLLILFAFNAIIALSVAQSPVVGVLEDVPGGYVSQPDIREVRVVFQKIGRKWSAFPGNCPDETCLKKITSRFPHDEIWNVGFDGKLLGQVIGHTPDDFKFYAGVGLQKITSHAAIPTVGRRSEEFGGYTGASVYRPLIANSQPYLSDPDGWKPSQLTSGEIQLFRHQFRKKFPKLCKSSEDETQLEPFPYRDQDIRVIKSYASQKGWKIARLHVEGAVDCGDVEGGFQLDNPWFALDSQGRSDYLDSGIWLVDAGDYDHDGTS